MTRSTVGLTDYLIERGDAEILLGKMDDLTVFQVNDALGAGDDGGDITGDDVLTAAEAEDEG